MTPRRQRLGVPRDELDMRYFVLDADGQPQAVEDVLEWARWFETADRQLALDEVGDVCVSTVFIGLDHNWIDKGPPALWETVIFGGAHAGAGWRCTSRALALEAHAAALARVRKGTQGVDR